MNEINTFKGPVPDFILVTVIKFFLHGILCGKINYSLIEHAGVEAFLVQASNFSATGLIL